MFIRSSQKCFLKWIIHDDDIKWKHFPRYWPFVRGIHRSPVSSLHKGQWRGALILCLICTRINGWVNSSEAGNLRRHRAHYDITVMNCKSLMAHVVVIFLITQSTHQWLWPVAPRVHQCTQRIWHQCSTGRLQPSRIILGWLRTSCLQQKVQGIFHYLIC